jgi:hypothetical protein
LHYQGERAPYNQKAWDVRIGRERIEVKALRRNAHNKRTNLSPIRSESGYDVLVIVVFAEDFTIEKAVCVPRSVVNELYSKRKHVNGRVVTLTRRLLGHPATEEFSISDAMLDA